jgi:hypothetical protein
MQRAYIAYASQNQAFAERLAQDLADAGLSVWLDAGTKHDIQHALETGDLVIVCLSTSAIDDLSLQQKIKAVRDKSGTVIPVLVDDRLNTLQSKEKFDWFSKNPVINFENRYEQAFAELLQTLSAQRLPVTFDNLDAANIPNPFKGLEAFQQIDSALFFGRDDMARLAINRLRETHFLAIVGASGVGKSSLVRAGIIPLIRQAAIDDSDTWVVLLFTPTSHPIDELARRLALLVPHNLDDIKAELRQSGQVLSLIDAALQDKPPQARLLLVIDQFEEVFTQTNEIERELFLDILRVLSTLNSRVHIIIAMRGDYFGHLSHYPDLAQLFEQQHLLALTEMPAANLAQAIESPAQVVGLRYEAGLVDRLLHDAQVESGSLPRLQYALYQLFRKRTDTRLTITAYQAMRGVQGVIAHHADMIFNRLNKEQQDVLRRILLSLLDVSEAGEVVLGQVLKDELVFPDVANHTVVPIINQLSEPVSRLITMQQFPRPTVRPMELSITHEAFIQAWDKFQQWIAEHLENLKYESELRRAAANWEASEHDEGYLLRGAKLTQAEKWFRTHYATGLQQAYLEASVQLQRKEEVEARIAHDLRLRQRGKRRTQWLVGITVILLMTVVFALMMWLTGGFRIG